MVVDVRWYFKKERRIVGLWQTAIGSFWDDLVKGIMPLRLGSVTIPHKRF